MDICYLFIIIKDITMEQVVKAVSNLQIIPVENYYAIKPSFKVQEQGISEYIHQSFIFFVIQCRSGMNQQSLNMLKKSVLEMCEGFIQKGIEGMSFIINEQYYGFRNFKSYEGAKDMVQKITIGDNVSFENTLIKLRHSIESQFRKLEDKKLTLIYFTSFVELDPLNPIKPSYIRYLNRHKFDFYKQINRIRKSIVKFCADSQSYVVGYRGKQQNALDYDLLYQFVRCTHHYGSYRVGQSFNSIKKALQQTGILAVYQSTILRIMIPKIPTEYQKYMFEKQEKKKKQKEEQRIRPKIQEDSDTEYFEPNKYIYHQITMVNDYEFSFSLVANGGYFFVEKDRVDLGRLKRQGYTIVKGSKNQVILKQNNVNYHEPNLWQEIFCKTNLYKNQLNQIIWKILYGFIKSHRRKIAGNKFETIKEIRQQQRAQVLDRINFIDKISREIHDNIMSAQAKQIFKKPMERAELHSYYNMLKSQLDRVIKALATQNKKQQIVNYDELSIAIFSSISDPGVGRRSLQLKLAKKVNANPRLIQQTYNKIEQIATKNAQKYLAMQAKYKAVKSQIGNCITSDYNFVKALENRDCLVIMFEVQCPETAIADPGRLRMRQICPFVMTMSAFFQTHYYKSGDSFRQQKRMQKTRQVSQIEKQNYQQMWDYWNRADQQRVNIGIMPLFICDQNWQTSKLLMKLAMAWTACKEPLAYTFSQAECIPFMVLSFLIKYVKEIEYQIVQWQKQIDKEYYLKQQTNRLQKQWAKEKLQGFGEQAKLQTKYYYGLKYQNNQFYLLILGWIKQRQQIYGEGIVTKKAITQYLKKVKSPFASQIELYLNQKELNKLKFKRDRFKILLRQVQRTCQRLIRDFSSEKFEEKLSQKIIKKYINYDKPINRTVDVINNNSSFLGQLYTMMKSGLMQKPTENLFHQFFKKLVQEQLRRQTDVYGWNDQQAQDKFQDKLLNCQTDKMTMPEFIHQSEFRDIFLKARLGMKTHRTEFQIQRQNLQMTIRKNNKYNETQRLILIEYKRLYENRVLWMWYVRFLLYEQRPRIEIYKWKCLDLTNSYQVFTMVIQNKKQRKNSKRRQAIMNGQYVNPYDYYAAREYLEKEFMRLRNKKENKNIVILNTKKYKNAAQVFSSSPDLLEAAGALMNIQIGHDIGFFYNELLQGQPSRLEFKLQQLLNGEFEDVRLFKRGWKMSRKRMNKLRIQYPAIFLKYQYMF